MEKVEFDNLLKKIKDNLRNNKNAFDRILNEEMSRGKPINFKKISKIIDEYEKISMPKPENKSIAVYHIGTPEVTITCILDSILHNNRLTMCVKEFKSITTVIVKAFFESMDALKIKNRWINYSANYNEIYLSDNQKHFEKVIYIGDYFEYQKFTSFFNYSVEYNNFGYLKLFIDKVKFEKEYEKIMKYAYEENISVEIYTDIDDFISESKEEDYSVVFADLDKINQIKRGLRAGTLFINAFPYDTYKFEIER